MRHLLMGVAMLVVAIFVTLCTASLLEHVAEARAFNDQLESKSTMKLRDAPQRAFR